MLTRIIRTAIGAVAGNGRWLLLLAVATAAAGLYAWGAKGHAQRDAVLAWADRTCAATGVGYRPISVAPAAAGTDVATVYPPGVRCEHAVTQLVAFRRDAAESTARLLADAMAAQDAKRARDLATTAQAARDARAAATMMETANAKIGPDDRVARDWFAALNRAAGLRASAD